MFREFMPKPCFWGFRRFWSFRSYTRLNPCKTSQKMVSLVATIKIWIISSMAEKKSNLKRFSCVTLTYLHVKICTYEYQGQLGYGISSYGVNHQLLKFIWKWRFESLAKWYNENWFKTDKICFFNKIKPKFCCYFL